MHIMNKGRFNLQRPFVSDSNLISPVCSGVCCVTHQEGEGALPFYEYELCLDTDTQSNGHTQWFYFAVHNGSNCKARIHITNFRTGRNGRRPVKVVNGRFWSKAWRIEPVFSRFLCFLKLPQRLPPPSISLQCGNLNLSSPNSFIRDTLNFANGSEVFGWGKDVHQLGPYLELYQTVLNVSFRFRRRISQRVVIIFMNEGISKNERLIFKVRI